MSCKIGIIIGGPASGKGTRAKILAHSWNVPAISTGELLREYAKTNLEIQELLTKGIHIRDEIVTKILFKRVSEDDCKKGYILDGYPRSIGQAYVLDSKGIKISACVELIIPDKIVFERILHRLECKECGKLYGLDNEPKEKNICDICKAILIRRSDDTEETLRVRIDRYETKTKPILDYYMKKGILVQLDSSCDPEKILEIGI